MIDIETHLRSYQHAENIRGETRAMCGRAADEIKRLRAVETAAAAVCWFDWSENDDDAVSAVAELRAQLGPVRAKAPVGRNDEQKPDGK